MPLLLKDGAPWRIDLVEGLGNLPVFDRLEKFKSELRRFHSGFFTEQPESLTLLIAGALRKAEKSLLRQSQSSDRHIISAKPEKVNIAHSALTLPVQRQAFSRMLAESLAIAPDDQLIVVHDESLDPFLPALIDELSDRRIQSTIIQLPKKYQLSLITDTGAERFEHKSFPAGIAAAIRQASAILSCLDSDLATTVVRRAVLMVERPGTSRLLHIPGLNDEILQVLASQDTASILREANLLGLRLSQASKVEVVTNGYQNQCMLTVDVEPGMTRLLINEPTIKPGSWSNVPNGTVSVIPTNASGSVLIDGSAPGIVLNSREPATLNFETGRLVSIEGREPFRSLFNQMVEAARAGGDPEWNAIAELSIGVNAGVSTLSGTSLIDSKARGAVTVGVGDNSARGGRIRSRLRTDFVTLRGTVSIDGVEVLHSGVPTNL